MISQPNPHYLMNSSRSSECEVSLNWITPDPEFQVVKDARISNPANQENRETMVKLLKYLIKHKHWSPFEMASMSVTVNTTRAISQQIIRHRSMHFQEFSQRYADTGLLGMAVIPHLRRQDPKNRQNSIDDFKYEEVSNFYRRISEHFEQGEHLYQELLCAGVAKECARAILPLNTRTRVTIVATIRDWMFYLQLRNKEGTQNEHKMVSNKITEIFSEKMPNIYEAFFC